MTTRHFFLTAAIAALTTLTADAALVTWGAATNISGDSDVRTDGTLYVAANLGPPGVSATTINGVNFAAGDVGVNGTTTTTSQPLSSAYLTLLNSAILLPADTNVNFTITGLTVGENYLVQFWVNNSGRTFFSQGDFPTNFSDGLGNDVDLYPGDNGIGLGPGGSNLPPAPGQFVVGTFTADATGSQTFQAISGEIPGVVNGLQVRQLVVAAVPEPGTAIAGVMLAGLLGVRRRRATA